MSTQWYSRYVGDYMRDTRNLSLAEHGAYTLLLDHYYATGAALDPDMAGLFRVCGAQTDEERAAIAKVADLYFAVNGDGKRHNKRADKEIEKSKAISDQRARAGKIGGVSTWQGKRKAKAIANAIANATTSTSTSTGEHPEPLGESRKRPPKLSDEEWIGQIRATYGAMKIDVAREESKCRAWCTTKGQNFSRGRFLNWLNRASENNGLISVNSPKRQMIPSELIPL